MRADEQLLYNPFVMVTSNRKVAQIALVQAIITEEMNKFNALFEDTTTHKQGLIQSLQEKNARMRQLIPILKLNPDGDTIFEPQPQDDESPEAFLSVKDSCERKVHFVRDSAEKSAEAADWSDQGDKEDRDRPHFERE